jgi:hypothetical protein
VMGGCIVDLQVEVDIHLPNLFHFPDGGNEAIACTVFSARARVQIYNDVDSKIHGSMV